MITVDFVIAADGNFTYMYEHTYSNTSVCVYYSVFEKRNFSFNFFLIRPSLLLVANSLAFNLPLQV